MSTADAVLSHCNLREEGKGVYRGPSPLRADSDSNGFKLTIDGPEHGAWKDHVSGEGGSLYDLVERLEQLGVSLPINGNRNTTTKRGYSGLADYAEAHNATAAVFQAAGWREAQRHGRPALQFETATGPRWRFTDGNNPPYINPKGYQRCWYGLARAVELAEKVAQPLILCNGEASTVAAQHYGLAACCVTGGEQPKLPVELVEELRTAWDGPVKVIFDCDEPGRAKSVKLAAYLRSAGLDAAALDLGGGIEGYDVADFVGRYRSSAPAMVADLQPLAGEPDERVSAPAQESSPYRIMSLVDIWEQQAGLQKAWDGWMLLNNLTVIGGVPGVGKSPMLLWIVKGFLEGEWPDGSPVPEEMLGRGVVYCMPEGFAEQTQLLQEWGLPVDELSKRVIVPTIPVPGDPTAVSYIFKIDSVEGAKSLEWHCDQVNPALIVVDGLRAAMTGDESSSTDVDKFTAPLVKLAVRHNAAVVFTHHLTKGSEDASRAGEMPSSDWFRGSGAILAAVRSAWIVDQPDVNNLGDRRVTLVKANAGPKGVTMGFSMGNPVDGLSFTQNVAAPPPKTKAGIAERFILQALRSGRATHDELFGMAEAEGLGISAATFRNARVGLSNQQRIISQVEGRTYYWCLPVVDDDLLF